MKRGAYKALSAAAALSMLGLGLVVSPAFAAPGADGPVVSVTDSSFPKAGTKGSITVTKYKGAPDSGKVADGTANPPATTDDRAPLKGAGFTLYHVTKTGALDLSTNQGWADLAALKKAAGSNLTVDALQGAGYTVTAQGDEQSTNDSGVAKFSELPLGVYLLVETTVPTGVAPSAPSIISVPMTAQSGDGAHTKWITDINVYPKNQPQEATKKVLDFNAAAEAAKSGAESIWPTEALGDLAKITHGTVSGQNMVYRISGTIPQVAGQKLTLWGISDKLPTTVSMGNSNTIKVFKYAPTTGTYTPITNFTASFKDNTLNVWLVDKAYTEDLKDIQADTQVVVFFQVSVKDTSAADKTEIVNGAEDTPAKVVYTTSPDPKAPVTPGDPITPGDNPPGDTPVMPKPKSETPTPSVTSKFGNVTFVKTDGTNKLAGAKFKLYYCADEAKTPIKAGGTENGIVTSAETTGEIKITGLQYSNFKNGAAYSGFDTNKEYCLQETEAPAGYELLAEPIKFNVTDDNTHLMGDNNNIVNVPANGGFKLPVTGANGLILLSVAGGLLIAGGVFFAVARRRREEA